MRRRSYVPVGRRSIRHKYGGADEVVQLKKLLYPLTPGVRDYWKDSLVGLAGVPIEKCSTAYSTRNSDLDATAADLVLPPEKLCKMCFSKRGICCDAMCYNKLRCHNPPEYEAKIMFKTIQDGVCNVAEPPPGIAAEMPAPGADGVTTLHLCGAHLKTLQEASNTGKGWAFVRWASMIGAKYLCYYVVVPAIITVTLMVAAPAAAAVAAATIPALPAAAAGYVSSAAAMAPAFAPFAPIADMAATSAIARATGMDRMVARVPVAVGRLAQGDKPYVVRGRNHRGDGRPY